ncbi:hypothetical protein [Paenibacillus sp. DS2015]|uniref:hypothetical protein n=1 Tax=Paenibacillus sp. DS2015 TaxID=3373917 RepID=UPI003D1C3B78
MGITALAKDQMKIVVDLNKKQIVEAPDTNLTIIQPISQAGAGEVQFQRKLEKAQSSYSIMMWLDDSFTDAKGEKHKMLTEGLSQRGHGVSTKDDTVEDNYSYNFGEKALDYPQPLTIEIKEYWNPIMETQTVELFSKK